MKRVIESAIWAALVCSLAACERDAISAGRQSAMLHKGHNGSAPSGQDWEVTGGGPREVALVAPLQVPTGSGGTGGSGGTFGTGGTGGSGGTFGSGGSGGTSTGGSGGTSTGGSGGIGGVNTGGTLSGER